MNAFVPVEPDPLVGATLADRYRVVRKLGEGGMGAVYEGEHLLIKKRVAIKVLHPQFATSAEVVARFHQEALAATAIGHEHIVEVNDLGRTTQGAAFMVLEYLAGRDFADLLQKESPLSIGRIAHIVGQICDAVQAAHDKGIVHRDLKPENVFLIKRGGDPDWVKVLDFGISKIKSVDGSSHSQTKTGSIIGTAYYMAPEQAMARKEIDHRADIWAIGVILYQALTGRFPFDQEAFPMLLISILQDTPPAPASLRSGIPDGLNALVMRCLEKLPDKRPSSCSEVVTALGAYRELLTIVPSTRLSQPQPEQVQHAVAAAQSMSFEATLPHSDASSRPLSASTYAAAGLSRPKWVVPTALSLTMLAGGAAVYVALDQGTHAATPPNEPTESPPAVSPRPDEAGQVAELAAAEEPASAQRDQLDFIVSPPTAVVLIDQHPLTPNANGVIVTPVRAEDLTVHELRIEARDYRTRVENLRLSYPQHIVVSLDPGSGEDDRRAPTTTHERPRMRPTQTGTQGPESGNPTVAQTGDHDSTTGTQTGTQIGTQIGTQTGTQPTSDGPPSAEIRSDGVVVLPPGGALKRRPSH